MNKNQKKQIEELLFQVYDKGLQQQECNLTDYYEKIYQALNKPAVSKRILAGCEHPIGDREYTYQDTYWCHSCERVIIEQPVREDSVCAECGGELYYDYINKYFVCKKCFISQ